MNLILLKKKLYTRFKNVYIINKIFEFFGSNLTPKKWVFIIGCYNSGTTLLSEIFERHPDVQVLPDEGVMLTNQLPRPEDFGWRRMWCQCEDKMQINSIQAAKISNIIKRHWSHFVKGKPEIVVEKSISNATRLEFFQTHFPNSFFIYIIRNGYADSEGISRKAEVLKPLNQHIGKKYPIQFSIKQWKRSIEVVDKQRPNILNFLEIRYEDLTENIENTTKKIADFLEISHFNENLLKEDFIVHGKKMKISNQNEKSFTRLNHDEWSVMNEVAEVELKKYNYYSEKL